MTAPKSLDDLRLCAESDLGEPKRGVVLKWAMWHALAAGARRKAERAAEYIDRQAWDTWLRASALTAPNDQAMRELVLSTGPSEFTRKAAGETVAEAVAFEAACANVLELLKKRTARPQGKREAA